MIYSALPDKREENILTASMSVNCSATMMGSNDRKLKAESSSSKPLSSCVAKGQPMCSPEKTKTSMFFHQDPSTRTRFQHLILPICLLKGFSRVPKLVLIACTAFSLNYNV